MVIDLETQIWSSTLQLGTEGSDWKLREDVETWAGIDASPRAHEAAMNCVDASVVLGFRSAHLGAHISAETVAAFTAKQPHRRVGFAGIDPLCDNALDSISAALELGLRGVVICPGAQNYHPTHSRAMRVYERCQDLAIPVLVRPFRRHTSQTTMAYARPLLFDEVAKSFPNLRMVIGGLGYPWIDEMFVLIAKHRHLYTDLAGIVSRPWQLYNALLAAHEHRVMEKILFASGFPFETPERAIGRIYSLNSYSHGTDLPSVPRPMLKAIIERDTFDCLGIERPEGATISGGIGLTESTPGTEIDDDDDLRSHTEVLSGMLREHPSEASPSSSDLTSASFSGHGFPQNRN